MKLGINERLKGKKLYKECWKELTIKGVTYKVSNLGRIFGKTRELKQRLNKDGYLDVTVGKGKYRTTRRVHRLVMMAFRPCEGMENLEVDHIDTCRTKNELSNLRWTSHIENCNNPLSREHYSDCMIGDKNPFFGKTHTDEQKAKWSKERGRKCICIETGEVFPSFKKAGESVGVSGDAINKVCRGEHKTSGGYHWAYYEDNYE